MELRHIKYFLSVSELGSFTRASEKLFIAQPALSMQIRQLEEEVGVPLLTRHARGVKPTPAGESFMKSCRAVLEQLERAKQQARHVEEGVSGVVSFGYVPSTSHVVIPEVVRALRRKHAGIEIQVQEMITAHQVEALSEERIDFGLARPPLQDKAVVVETSVADPFCVAMPQDHELAKGTGAVSISAVASEPLVSFSRFKAPAFFDQALHLCTSAGFSPRLRYEASTIYSMLDLVSAGLGLAIVPRTCALLPTEGVVFRPLPSKIRKGSLALIRRKGPTTPATQLVADIVGKIFVQVDRRARMALRQAE